MNIKLLISNESKYKEPKLDSSLKLFVLFKQIFLLKCFFNDLCCVFIFKVNAKLTTFSFFLPAAFDQTTS